MLKKTIVILFCLQFFIGCDFTEGHDFIIINKTSKNIQIQTNTGFDNGIKFKDSIHNILENDKF